MDFTENICPITHKKITELDEPVVAPDGHTYEKQPLIKWLRTHGTSPVTRQPIRINQLIINRALQRLTTVVTETKVETPDNIKLVLSAALDVSGSMDEEAVVINKHGKRERHGLSLLDLAKHSVNTIVHAMDESHMFSLVTFSEVSKVVFPAAVMNQSNKDKVLAIVKNLTTEGSTNIWSGIYDASRQVDINVDNNPKRCVWLLTDGHPNVDPPKSYVEMINDYNQQYGSNRVIRTFGFGESIDSKLLTSIADRCNGSFAYIPDCGFIGTVVSHAFANSQIDQQVDETIEHKKQRELFIQVLQKILSLVTKPNYGSELMLEPNFKKANTLYETYMKDNISEFHEDEILVALSDLTYWRKWAPHYFRSLMTTHKKMECNNFKDTSIKQYISYYDSSWKELLDKTHELFKSLPAPEPTVSRHYDYNYGRSTPRTYTPVNMSTYSQVDNGCFHEDAHIETPTGKIKCKDITPGTVVFAYNPKRQHLVKESVLCVVKTKCGTRNFAELSMDGTTKLYITAWHPVFHINKWQFPAHMGSMTEKDSEYVYNFVLEGRTPGIIIDGFTCITLAGRVNNDKVASHEFWGTENVVNCLKKSPEWSSGIVHVTKEQVHRNDENIVTKILF